MYELELAFMVVAHSQRDPGEYMAQLQTFAARPSGPLRRHALDMHLGRWPHALRDLVQAGDAHFDAALDLARDKVTRLHLIHAQPPAQPAGGLGALRPDSIWTSVVTQFLASALASLVAFHGDEAGKRPDEETRNVSGGSNGW